MIAEEILKVLERFRQGSIVTLTTENDKILENVEIRGFDSKRLTLGCPNHPTDPDEIAKIPWDEITYIGQSGISVIKELPGRTRMTNITFMKAEKIKAIGVEMLSLKLPKNIKKYITWSDPFTVVVDGVIDVDVGRNLLSTPDNHIVPAGYWEIHSNGLWGLMSWDSEIVEAGIA